MNQLLTMPEVEKVLRISKHTLRRLINEDPAFRTVKLKRKRLMSEAALNDYIRSREETLPGQASK